MDFSNIVGKGLGLREEFRDDLLKNPPSSIDFLEIAPENWIGQSASKLASLADACQQYPMLAHGLNLSIGGIDPLDTELLSALKQLFKTFNMSGYSEHLSFCTDNQGRLYDLLPIPFTHEAVLHVSSRIKQAQEFLDCRIAFENSSYYYTQDQEMSESDFIQSVVSESGCQLLLDVNNVYVNSVNHGYDPFEFIAQLPSESIAYIHIAGHWQKETDLIIDTHAAAVIEPVWDLLAHTYQQHGPLPTLLERDADIPPLSELLDEVGRIGILQQEMAS